LPPLLRAPHSERALVVDDHPLEPQSLERRSVRRGHRVHLGPGQEAGHRWVSVQVVLRTRHPAIGGEGEQRFHLIDLGPLRPVDLSGKADELLAPGAGRHQRCKLEGLLMVDDHVAQKEQILMRVELRRGAGRLSRDTGGAEQEQADDPPSGAGHFLADRGGPDGCGLVRFDEYTTFFGTSSA
jgi:hypothetical protein